MNKRNAYYLKDKSFSILKLSGICLKIIKLGKTIDILVANKAKAEEMSTKFWSVLSFIPHGLQHDINAKYHPILILYEHKNKLLNEYRDVIINFEEIFIVDSENRDILLWNCDKKIEGFIIYNL